MITENLSTLKIHKLTQAQYDRELAAGRIDENALYLTPDEEVTLSDLGIKVSTEELNYMNGVTSGVQTQLDGKAPKNHQHSATDISSGSLPVEYGGTGATTASDALTNLGGIRKDNVALTTIASTSEIDLGIKLKYYKRSNIVTIIIDGKLASDFASNEVIELGKLPTGCRPLATLYSFTQKNATLQTGSDGNVFVINSSGSSIASGSYLNGTCTFGV